MEGNGAFVEGPPHTRLLDDLPDNQSFVQHSISGIEG